MKSTIALSTAVGSGMSIVRGSCFGVLALAVTLFAMPSKAAGVALRWNACIGDGGVVNRTFACNTAVSNNGSQAASGSFALSTPLTGIVAAVSTIDFVTAGPALPDWWLFGAGPANCRSGLLAANATLSPSAVACQDWTLGSATSGLSPFTVGLHGPSSATADAFQVVSTPQGLVAGQEYFAFNLLIRNLKTTGPGSCSGCSVPACIALRQVAFDVAAIPGFPDLVLTGPMIGADANYITWQGGVGAGPLPGGACPAATPTRNSTWGAVKSLYR